MSSFSAFSLTEKDLENTADIIKTTILANLVKEGLLNFDAANDWCATHTIIVRNKTIFRTISKLWKETAENSGLYYIVVNNK